MEDVVPQARTLEMTVDETAFIVDRLGQDCHPLQFLRELTQNAIEAILATEDGSGQIIWDVDWATAELTGTKKLSITDTGIGMTGTEIRKYINQLSSSSRVQSLEGNFGVGAKVAGATRNHAGMQYLSWQEGVGTYAILWKDPVSGQYGLMELPKDGGVAHYRHLEDQEGVKPEIIQQHGTKVILNGMHDDEDTIRGPEGVQNPSRWMGFYLNTRYFTFPEGVTIKAREGWDYPHTETNNLLRTAYGQKWFLDQHADSSGSVDLGDAMAHWWILDKKRSEPFSGSFHNRGHVAALHSSELYEIQTSRSGIARLQAFGVLFGYAQVVIYVEPRGSVITDTARTRLLRDNRPLPWSEWAERFRSDLPVEIQNHMDQITTNGDGDRSTNISKRLKDIEDILRIKRYRPKMDGAHHADFDRSSGGKARRSSPAGSTSEPLDARSSSSGSGGTSGSVYALFLSDDGRSASKSIGGSYPTVEWVSEENGKRQLGDLEDRAAKYLPEQHCLMINEDFRVFAQMIDRWCIKYGDSSAIRTVVTSVVKEWFEQALVEAVLGAKALEGGPWNVDDFDDLLSPEALTAVVLPRYHIDVAVSRVLGSKLGSLKKIAS